MKAYAVPPEQLSYLSRFPAPGSNIVLSASMSNLDEVNSALTYFVQTSSLLDSRPRVIASLVAQIVSEPAFSILRTREQLGYVVHCRDWWIYGTSECGLCITVQSERTPAYLEERVEAFLDEMKGKIADMAEEEFEETRQGLEKGWKQKVNNLNEEADRYRAEIDSGYLEFLRRTCYSFEFRNCV